MELIGLRFDLLVTLTVCLPVVVLAVWLGMKARRHGFDSGWGLSGIFGYIFGGLAAIILVASFVPFKAPYVNEYRTEGEVLAVSNVFESGSGEITPGYVVTLDKIDTPLVFTDPRILNRAGQNTAAVCSVEWVPRGADRYHCRIADQ